MIGPFIQLIVWTTLQVYSTIMIIFPRPLIAVPRALERFYRAESAFHRIARNANTTSYQIVQTLRTSYFHAPLCPLPAELPYLVPRLTWECLAMVYRQVRMMTAERQIVEDLALPVVARNSTDHEDGYIVFYYHHTIRYIKLKIFVDRDYGIAQPVDDNMVQADNIVNGVRDIIVDAVDDIMDQTIDKGLGRGR